MLYPRERVHIHSAGTAGGAKQKIAGNFMQVILPSGFAAKKLLPICFCHVRILVRTHSQACDSSASRIPKTGMHEGKDACPRCFLAGFHHTSQSILHTLLLSHKASVSVVACLVCALVACLVCVLVTCHVNASVACLMFGSIPMSQRLEVVPALCLMTLTVPQRCVCVQNT